MTTGSSAGEPPPRLDPDRIGDLLAATATTVGAELRGLGEDGASWSPAPGEWCAKEVVGHLSEAERRGFAGRIRILIAEDEPDLLDWDEPGVAAARRDCAKSIDEVLGEFLSTRAEAIALARTLTTADLARAGIHPIVGRLTVAEVAAEWVHHDRNHVRQLLAIGQAVAWRWMGAARRFSDPSA